jgi:hypothetical protein
MTVFIALACDGFELQTYIVTVSEVEFNGFVNGLTAESMLARDALKCP